MKKSAAVVIPFRGALPKPPKELKKAGRTQWNAIKTEYGINDPGGLAHLITACRSEDDIQRMRATVARDGDTLNDRFGQKREHPLLGAIRGLEAVKRQALKSLNLHIEPLRDRPGPARRALEMPTKRTRVIHQRKNMRATQLFYASDGLWGDEADVSKFEAFTYKSPTCCPDECREVWLAIREELLPQWIKERPGSRPPWWYLFDSECPCVSAEDIQHHGWTSCYFTKDIPDLRRRIGGIGDPAYLHYSLVPEFDCGVPDKFVTVDDVEWHREEGEEFSGIPFDPNDPPKYESQAAYLDRHNLLAPAERRRLRKKDFKPVKVSL